MERWVTDGQRYMKRIAMAWGGAVLIVIGIAGLVLPFLPGAAFIVLGAAVFSRSIRKGIVSFLVRYKRHLPVSENYLKHYLSIANRLDKDDDPMV